MKGVFSKEFCFGMSNKNVVSWELIYLTHPRRNIKLIILMKDGCRVRLSYMIWNKMFGFSV